MNRLFLWLYITVFFNVVTFGMVSPILPLFAKTFNATSFEVGLLAAVFALAQFLFAPIIGKASDRYGRRPILLLSVFFTGLSLLWIGFANTLPLVFIGMFLQGISGAGVLPAALAYTADITKGESRGKYISRVTGTFAVGFMVGPVFGGILGAHSMHLPYFVAAAVALLNSIFIFFLLPETHHTRDTSLAVRQGLLSIKPLFAALRGDMAVLFLLLFIWAMYVSNYSLTIPFYNMEKFGLDAFGNGVVFSFVGLIAAITQWVILPWLDKKWGDKKTLLYGLIFLFIGQLLIPIAFNVPALFIFLSLTVLGSAMMRPLTNALLSKKTKEGQGVTMGIAFSFESLGKVIGPLLLGFIIVQLGVEPPFYVTAFLTLIGIVLFYRVEYKKRQ